MTSSTDLSTQALPAFPLTPPRMNLGENSVLNRARRIEEITGPLLEALAHYRFPERRIGEWDELEVRSESSEEQGELDDGNESDSSRSIASSGTTRTSSSALSQFAPVARGEAMRVGEFLGTWFLVGPVVNTSNRELVGALGLDELD